MTQNLIKFPKILQNSSSVEILQPFTDLRIKFMTSVRRSLESDNNYVLKSLMFV